MQAWCSLDFYFFRLLSYIFTLPAAASEFFKYGKRSLRLRRSYDLFSDQLLHSLNHFFFIDVIRFY